MVFLIALFIFSLLPSPTVSQNATVQCPLDFSVLSLLTQSASSPAPNGDTDTECASIRQALRIVLSNYLQRTNSFLPPLNSSESCWIAYGSVQSLINPFRSNLDIRKSCGFKTEWISQGCMNITTKAQFEALVPQQTLNDVVSSCNQSLENSSPCASCTATLSTIQASYLIGPSVGNLVDCVGYPSIYAAAFANIYGPRDKGTAKCLFSLENPVTSESGSKKNVEILVVLLVFGVGFCVILGGGWLYLRKRKRRESFVERVETSLEFSSKTFQDSQKLDEGRRKPDLPIFDVSTILAATDHFSPTRRLGQGGFGPVYKGQLANGQEIAVKTLSRSSRQGTEEFKNEVMLITKLQHRNLVRLFGCCIHKEERMLIYEYMPNKSLDFFIFDKSGRQLLDWNKRFEIIFGIARGVLYLHQDSRLKIIHRDLKTSNVLLDAAMNPKISDFGLARMFGDDQTEANTNRVVGTYGYMSPEYAMEGLYSTKSDVFSYGVLTLEIISGKRNNHYHITSPCLNLIGHVWDLWMEGKALDIVDSSLGQAYLAHEVSRCIQIGLLCVQEQATDRPTMVEIVFMLGTETPLPAPKKPAFINRRNISNGQDSSNSAGAPGSINDVTMSTLEAR